MMREPLIPLFALCALTLCACGGKDTETVKNLVLPGQVQSMTLGDALSTWKGCRGPGSWRESTSERRERVVEFSCPLEKNALDIVFFTNRGELLISSAKAVAENSEMRKASRRRAASEDTDSSATRLMADAYDASSAALGELRRLKQKGEATPRAAAELSQSLRPLVAIIRPAKPSGAQDLFDLMFGLAASAVRGFNDPASVAGGFEIKDWKSDAADRWVRLNTEDRGSLFVVKTVMDKSDNGAVAGVACGIRVSTPLGEVDLQVDPDKSLASVYANEDFASDGTALEILKNAFEGLPEEDGGAPSGAGAGFI